MVEPRIPFPQANDMKKVLKICKKATKRNLSVDDVVKMFRFTKRQAYLYLNACVYLSLLSRDYSTSETIYVLTPLGESTVVPSAYSSKSLLLSLMNHVVLRRSMAYYYLLGHIPSKKIIVEFIKESEEDKFLNETTLHRRASTIYAWLKWAQINCPTLRLELNKFNVKVL